MIINPYAFGVSYDPDAQAFFTASGLTGATNLTAINNLVVALKGYGIWTKMKAIYPFVGGTAALHKWNLKDPRDLNAAFRLTFYGGWTHSATGATPNGTNAYGDSFLISSLSLSQNSTHVSYYSRTNSSGIEIEMNASGGGPQTVLEIRTTNTSYYAVNNAGGVYISHTDSDSRAFYIANRTASNVINGWRNNVKAATGTIASTGLPTGSMILGSTVYWTKKQCAFASIGDGLTDTEAANFYTAVNAYQVALSRNV